MRLILIALSALLMTAAAAPSSPHMSEQDMVAVKRAILRGNLLHAYDQAAWHGTDDLQRLMPDFAAKVGGWIVDGPQERPQIVFFDRDPADPHALYIADFEGTKLLRSRVLAQGEDRSLSAPRKAMIAARRAAGQRMEGAAMCKQAPFNTVVLPPESPGGPTLVYFLTPQTTNDAIPLGGHYLVEVAADGKARKPRPFTKSCLEMPLKNPEAVETAEPASIGTTHLLDPTPTEIHVFSAYAAGMPLFVATMKGGRLWKVENGSIGLLGDTDTVLDAPKHGS
jgi:hypothetical protein